MPNAQEVDMKELLEHLKKERLETQRTLEDLTATLQVMNANMEFILEHMTIPKEKPKSIEEYTHLLEYVTGPQLTRLLKDTRLLDKINFSSIPGCWIWKGTTQYGNPVYRPSEYPGERITGQKNTRRVLFDRFFPNVLDRGNLTKMPMCGNGMCVSPFHAMASSRYKDLLNGHDNPASLDFGINEETEYSGKPWKSPRDTQEPEKPKSTSRTLLEDLFPDDDEEVH